MLLQPVTFVERRRDDGAAPGDRLEERRLIESGGGRHAARGGALGAGADLEGRVGGDELGEYV